MPTGSHRNGTSGAVTGLQRQVTVDHPAITAVTVVVATVACPGAAVGDVVSLSPTAALPAGLVIAFQRVSATDTLQIGLANITAGTIDPAAVTYDVALRRAAGV